MQRRAQHSRPLHSCQRSGRTGTSNHTILSGSYPCLVLGGIEESPALTSRAATRAERGCVKARPYAPAHRKLDLTARTRRVRGVTPLCGCPGPMHAVQNNKAGANTASRVQTARARVARARRNHHKTPQQALQHAFTRLRAARWRRGRARALLTLRPPRNPCPGPPASQLPSPNAPAQARA